MSDAQTIAVERYTPGHQAALRRFAVGITVITVLGHAFFGFEQSYAQPLVALATAYSMQLLLEGLDAWSSGRRPRFFGGLLNLLDFLLSAHITALAVVMLLYFGDRLWVVAFGTAVAIGSKTIFRAPFGTGTRHFFNPSNFGIVVTLLVFPSVGLAMPWQFTAGLGPVGSWLLPAIILCVGSFLNLRYTKRGPLIAAFLGGFVLQAFVRFVAFEAPLIPMLAVATGVAAMIYTFFMLPDPATTPDGPRAQIAFGLAVALVYLALVSLHIVFGLFFALAIVCGVRGLGLYVSALASRVHLHSAPTANVDGMIPAARVN
jgi:Na+-translocating ferredoxin:NAD+ oxidoreductase RnfD subunit